MSNKCFYKKNNNKKVFYKINIEVYMINILIHKIFWIKLVIFVDFIPYVIHKYLR